MAKFLNYANPFPQRLYNFVAPSRYARDVLGKYDGTYFRSPATISLVRDDVKQFGTNKVKIEDPLIQKVFELALKEFLVARRCPIHLNDVMDMTNLECMKSSPGIPWTNYKTRGEVAADPKARNSIRWLWHRVKCGEKVGLPDCKAFVRVHITDDQPKVRSVWGFPTTVTFAEAQFALPLIEAYKNVKTPIAYGYDMATGGAMKLMRELPVGWYYCLDFKSFDKKVSAQFISLAFDILERNLYFGEYAVKGISHAEGLRRVWRRLKDYFIRTTIRLSTGERYQKSAGVPSGSYFTQLIDSIVNWMIIKYIELKIFGFEGPFKMIKVFGDDSIVVSHCMIDLEVFRDIIDSLGMELNMKKSFRTDDPDEVEFLGFKIKGGFPHRPLNKWMAHLYFPETPDHSLDDLQTRAIGLFYANCGVERRFDYIARRVVNLAPFNISMNRPLERFLSQLGVKIKDTELIDNVQQLMRLMA